MSFPSFLYLDGHEQGFISQGACDTGSLPPGMNTGPEDAIRVDALEWHTQIPVDPRHGQPTGMWQPGHVTITLWFDRTLPLLLEAACRRERFARWDLYTQAWRNGGYGLVTEMRLQLHEAVITCIKLILPNCQDLTLSDLEARAEVTFSYAGFTVEHLVGATLGSGGKEHRGALAAPYVRSVTFFQRLFSGQLFKESLRDLDQTLGRALGNPVKGVPGDPSALLGIVGGGGIAGVVKKTAPVIKWGAQEKHFPGHNSYTTGRSTLTSDPTKLAEKAGTGQQVGKLPVGTSGSKERVNFGEKIGTYIDQAGNTHPTTKGIIHYSNDGIHIVPARP